MAEEAKAYIYEKNLPQLFESMMTALMIHKPEDPISFLEQCLGQVHARNIISYEWSTFNTLFVNTEEKSDGRNEFAASNQLPSIGAIGKRNADGQNDPIRELANKHIVFVLGGPGSGKGTQCNKIAQEFGFLHLSTGDLLRQEVAKGMEQGKQLEEIMKEGKLVPVEITIGLLKDAMLSNLEAVGFVIDGFPRELAQNTIFTQQVCEGTMVLMFECSEEVMVERLVERGKISGRVDDNEETIRKRLQTYLDFTLPVIEHYQKIDKIKKVDAGRSVDEVYADVKKLFTQINSQ